MEEKLVESLVEAYSYGYKAEKEKVSQMLEIDFKKDNLNISKIKRTDNLKKWLDKQDPERFIFVDKRTFVFIDSEEGKLYAFMTESYKNQLIREFQKNSSLTYITALILMLNSRFESNHSQEESLFDVTPYSVDPYSDKLYDEAAEKVGNILENYGDIINEVRIITREDTDEDNPQIMMYEYSKYFEVLYSEDWTKYLPGVYNNNFEGQRKSKTDKEKQRNKKRQRKHTKLRKKDADIE